MDKQVRWQTLESLIFLDTFNLAVTPFTAVVADDLRFNKLVQTVLQAVLVLYLYCKNVKVLNPLLLIFTFITAYDVKHLSLECLSYQRMLSCILEPKL